MPEATRSPQPIRFGVFELDLRAGELRKKGVRVKLQEQPFQILLMLLEQPGEVVTREELRQKLWPEGTFVDFEHGLNAAVNRLRDALDDSPDTPRFVETIPRRGYRFIAPVGGAGIPSARLPATLARPRMAWWIGLALLGLTVAVLALLIGFNVGGLRQRLLGGVAPGEITSIAVLPLENLSHDPADDPFVDGMTEEVITQLGKISALERVISRHSVMQYKDTDKPLTEIARELNVDAVIEGSVLRVGERVRINVQLIQPLPERHLWAESYERDLSDVLALHAEVARAIASEIKLVLTPEEETQLASAPAVNPEAHRAYLRGRYFWNKGTPEGFNKATEYFQEASEIDPGYAPAYAGLADAYLDLALEGLPAAETEARRDAREKSRAAARRALEIDDTLSEAHVSLASIRFYFDWDWSGAETAFQRAIELNPSNALARQWHSDFLSAMGSHEEAIEEAKRAEELDPLSPLASNVVGAAFYYARQYDQAIQQYQKTLKLDANFPPALGRLGHAYLQKGLHEEALAAWQKMESVSGNEEMAKAYAELDLEDALHKRLDRVKGPSLAAGWGAIARIHAILGEKDEAFAWLEKAYEEHEFVSLKVHPGYDPLRSDPRFQDLLRRMNFPQ
ncbi:MAG: winged helix-turn-helix domain-containing protein [Terriglobia bacterium]